MVRRMRDSAFRAEQWHNRYAPHIEPINRMADEYRDAGRPMPYVAPVHGGVDARVLFVLRDPGPKTADVDRDEVRWLCVENDDQTAERMCGLFAAAGIRGEDTLPWNAYPWHINAEPTRDQLLEGLEPLRRLLDMMRELRVVVLMGNAAQTSWDLLLREGHAPQVQVLRTRHPSSQAFIGTAEQRAAWRAEQREVMAAAAAALEPLEPAVDVADPGALVALRSALDRYRPARQALLSTLRVMSNRDPLAELAEAVARAVLGGTLAKSRVQAHYDLITADGRAAQVKYLANTRADAWVNEHTVLRHVDVPLYVLVIFEAFELAGVLTLPTDRLAEIGQRLGKKHPRQDSELQFTRVNWLMIRREPDQFAALGVRCWVPSPAGK